MAHLLHIKNVLHQKKPFVIQTKTEGLVSFLPVVDGDMLCREEYGEFVAVAEFALRDAFIWCVCHSVRLNCCLPRFVVLAEWWPEEIKQVAALWKSADAPACVWDDWFSIAQKAISITSACYSKATGQGRELVVEAIISSHIVDSAMRSLLLTGATYGRLV